MQVETLSITVKPPNSNTHGDIKFARIIRVFEFTGVTCRPLLSFLVQANLTI